MLGWAILSGIRDLRDSNSKAKTVFLSVAMELLFPASNVTTGMVRENSNRKMVMVVVRHAPGKLASIAPRTYPMNAKSTFVEMVRLATMKPAT